MTSLVVASSIMPYLLAAQRLGTQNKKLNQLVDYLIDQVDDQNQRISAQQNMVMLKKILNHLEGETLGLISSEFVNINSYGINGYIAANCSSLYEAVVTTADLYATISDEKILYVIEQGGKLIVRWQFEYLDGQPELLRVVADHLMASYLAFGKQLGHSNINDFSASFVHEVSALEDMHRLYENYFGENIAFSQPHYQISMDIEFAKRVKILGANPELFDVLLNSALAKIHSLETTSPYLGQVQHLIRKQLERGAVDRYSLAVEMNVSERTLQRKLMAQRTTYQTLLNQTRHQQALIMLKNSALSIDDISEKLCFKDSRSLHRSFKQWSGLTLGQYRETLDAR